MLPSDPAAVVMLEGNAVPRDDESQSLTGVVRRQHTVVLCCAQSVVELVEEVARNLRGLGFEVQVICGAEARTVLLGQGRDRDEPTIYVVCVQGTLKEQVLKPLRQALATHGGPNQHLFVAVLDLALPLAMVGQIRRFAEALERPLTGRRRDALGERRQWREQLGPHTERVATRSYRAIELKGTEGPADTQVSTRRSGPQAIIGHISPARIGVTDKFRAVTGALPSVDAESSGTHDGSGARKRRKGHAPKVRVKAVANPRARRSTPHPRARGEASGASDPTTITTSSDDAESATTLARGTIITPARTGDTVVSGAPQRVDAGHTPAVPVVSPAAASVDDAAVVAPRGRGRAGLWTGAAIAGVAIAAVALWSTGAIDRLGRDDGRGGVQASAAAPVPPSGGASAPEPATLAAARDAAVDTPPAVADAPHVDAATALADAPTAVADAPTAVADAPTAVADAPSPVANAPSPVADAPTAVADAPSVPPVAAAAPAASATDEPVDADGDREPADTGSTHTSPAIPALVAAVAAHRLRETDTLWVTATSAAPRTWAEARKRCAALEYDGVSGFRLPHRRELQLLDAIGLLPDEPHWSRTVPDDDKASAWVLHPSTGALTAWLKDEPAASVCVRAR
ncbi:MAG: hypothetical protein IPH07_28220 [Deltaproteobacteria bacterium]|nr:hypothetical protein [Deltaproteobacteria bacterium]MBK8714785.1 hypothetical protein [Deltaproteobacteria bacterium]MBP7289539.1 hypothetical protein [Nannocystaceae bacterium]